MAAAKFCGIYAYNRAVVELERVDDTVYLYGLSESDVLECWLETHRDVSEHWDLIMEMALELRDRELLGAQYFEEILLGR